MLDYTSMAFASRPRGSRLLDPWRRAILVGTVVAILVAAAAAVGTIRSRARLRETATKSLANYVTVALEQFVNGYEAQLRASFVPVMPPPYEVDPLDRRAPQPIADMLWMINRNRHDPCRCLVSPGPTAIFRLEVGTRQSEAIDSLGTPLTRLDPLVANAVVQQIDSLQSTGWRYGFVGALTASGDQFVFFTHRADSISGRRFAHGFAVPATHLADRIFQPVFQTVRLIPRHLLERVDDNEEFISLEVRTGGGHLLFATEPRYGDGPSDNLRLPSLRGGITVTGRLNPRIKDALIPGGVPAAVPIKELAMIGLSLGLLITIAWLGIRAAELANLRADFASSVTHELRTPVTQIRLAAETLLLGRAKGTEAAQRSLASIVDETGRLQQLIDNVLHFSRAERRLTRVAVEPTALAPLVDRVVADFVPLMADRAIVVTTKVPDLVVVADPNAVRQILLNLLDNAARYGPDRQTISVEASANGKFIELSVEDQGPGIPPADMTRVWQPFVRLEHDRESVATGTGLGLAVVRELVAAQGGTCRMEAARDHGVRVVIQLPTGPVPR